MYKEVTGLGFSILSILREIAERHKGNAWEDSKMADWATIHINFSKYL